MDDEDSYRTRLKSRLLQVVERVIATEGFMAVRARRVAREADCSVGTLYNIFGDIDSLILAANEQTLNDLGEVLMAAQMRSAAGSLETRLMALATAYLDFATSNQQRWRSVFGHRLPDDRTLPHSYDNGRRKLLGLLDAQLEPVFADAGERGDAAFALFSGVHGIVLMSLDEKLAVFDPARCERQIRFIVSNVVKAIGQRP